MAPLTIRTILLIHSSIYRMATWASFLALLGCSAAKEKPEQGHVTSGPLTIRWNVEYTTSWAWFNQGGKPGHEDATSYFNVEHQGRPVTVPDDPAPGKPASFWQALFLKDAPKPAVLAGSFSMYLITDDDRSAGAGQATVKLLNQQDNDNGKYQWLDSENGQPGPLHENWLRDDSKSSRFLSGGRYLLVNKRIVLDVKTLVTYPIDINTAERLKQVDEFNPVNSRVVNFSPQKTQLVIIGFRRNLATNFGEYALVAIDFVKNTAYAVPFDRTDTRFFSVWDATPAWISTYFDWTTDTSGEEKLRLHSFKQLPYWQGRLNVDDPMSNEKHYRLRPVLPSMEPQFMAWLEKHYQPTALPPTYAGSDARVLAIQGSKLILYANPDDRSVTLVGTDTTLLRTIGEQFNKELAEGRFQEQFGRLDWD